MSFTEGEQPCDNFTPQMQNYGDCVLQNRHECYRCGGEVSYCENCHKDHHDGGYEMCIGMWSQ